jgi:hypothetical protein
MIGTKKKMENEEVGSCCHGEMESRREKDITVPQTH